MPSNKVASSIKVRTSKRRQKKKISTPSIGFSITLESNQYHSLKGVDSSFAIHHRSGDSEKCIALSETLFRIALWKDIKAA